MSICGCDLAIVWRPPSAYGVHAYLFEGHTSGYRSTRIAITFPPIISAHTWWIVGGTYYCLVAYNIQLIAVS